mmetsp:Transcript_13692/g.29818  ORF Transcript_13692/g.29818 Transcript_13692/m.29818 type:complete len:127 (+) Transcript_13692:210-590(+)
MLLITPPYQHHTSSIILGQSVRPQTSPLHNNLPLTTLTFHLARLIKTLNTQNITKVNSILCLTCRTRSVSYQIIGKEKVVRDCLGGCDNDGCTERSQDDGVDSTANDFVTDSEPEDGEDGDAGKVQ